MLAALYVRVSKEEQFEEGFSIPAQLKALKEYCIRNNIEVYKEYIEEGVTGQIENRPAFQECIKDAMAKKFHIILVHRYDRFARGVELSRRIKTQLKSSGVNVISITEPIEDSPMGFFIEGLHELMAEYYVRNLSREVKKGIRERVSQGLHIGVLPYGYYANGDTVLIDEKKAETVKEIFNMYAAGDGATKIAKYLNSINIPSPTGIKWSKNQVLSTLNNPKYIGKIKHLDEIYEAQFDGIIDEDLFNQVKSMYETRSSEIKKMYRGKNYTKFILLGLLVCGECGYTMRITCSHRNRSCQHYHYVCNKYKGGNCTNKTHHLSYKLEKDIENRLFMLMNSSDTNTPDIHTNNNLIKAYNSRLIQIEKELKRAKDAYQSEIYTLEELKAIKTKLDSEKADILKEIKEYEKNKPKEESKALKNKMKTLWDEYLATDDPNVKKQTLMKFIKRIVIYQDNRVKIEYHL